MESWVERSGEADMLARLCGVPGCPARADPGLAGGLRAWLEDGIAGRGGRAVGSRPAAAAPGRAAGAAAWGGAAVALAAGTADSRWSPSSAEVERCLVRTVFRLVVCGVSLTRPFEDALSACCADPRAEAVLRAVGLQSRREGARLRARVRAAASAVARDWRPPPAAWLPRTAERIRVPLGGGRVVLCASADLVVGAPSCGAPAVRLLRVHAEPPDDRHGAERRRIALAETVRSGVPPSRVASYHVAGAELVCDDVDDALLLRAVAEVLEAPAGRGPDGLPRSRASRSSRCAAPPAGTRAA